MNGVFPVSAAAALLFCGAPLSAKPAQDAATVVLWNQNTNFGPGVNSQVYEQAMSAYDDYALDDFVVPAGQTWIVTELDVTGAYVGGPGPASSETIWIYRSRNGRPVGTKYTATVTCTDNAGSFQCTLPNTRRPGVKLKSGTYLVSIAANCASNVCEQWQWTENTSVTGYQAMWGNPSNGWGTGCTAPEPLNTCFGGSPADFAFQLRGRIA